jgi:hypothetical protein
MNYIEHILYIEFLHVQYIFVFFNEDNFFFSAVRFLRTFSI